MELARFYCHSLTHGHTAVIILWFSDMLLGTVHSAMSLSCELILDRSRERGAASGYWCPDQCILGPVGQNWAEASLETACWYGSIMFVVNHWTNQVFPVSNIKPYFRPLSSWSQLLTGGICLICWQRRRQYVCIKSVVNASVIWFLAMNSHNFLTAYIELLRENEPMKAKREAELRQFGYPAYITSAGWLNYTDDYIRQVGPCLICVVTYITSTHT